MLLLVAIWISDTQIWMVFFVIDHDVDATDAGRHQRKGVKFRTFKFVLTLQLGSLLLECSWVVRAVGSSALVTFAYQPLRTQPMWPLCSSKGILILVFVVCALQLPIKGCRIVLGFVCQVLILFWLSFLVLFALYLQQLGTRTCHFAKYLLHFGTLTSHVHGICYILVLQTLRRGSCGFLQVFIQGFI